MEKLKTNELSLGLNQTLRNDLVNNFKKIQNGVDGQSDAVNKQIKDMLGDVPLQDQNEVTQARIDANGKQYQTMKSRLDVDQATAETALEEERQMGNEVTQARTNSLGKYHQNLSERLNDQENELTNSINEKLSQISLVPEAFLNLDALKTQYPNGKLGVFITTNDGHKYIWDNNQWQDAGIYQSVGISDGEALKIADKTLNVNNFIENGTFAGGLEGTNAKNYAKLSWNQSMFGKKWVSAKSGSDSPIVFQGVEFAIKQAALSMLGDPNISLLKFSFELISNYDADLILTLNLKDKAGEYIESSEVLNTLRVVANQLYSFDFIVPTFTPTSNFESAFVTISDPVAEPINFSIANLQITTGGI